MRLLYLALALCGLAAMPADALTSVSSCGSLSGDTIFKLTANLSSTSNSCIEMTGFTGFLELDCDGHSITTSGSNGFYPLYVHDNDVKLWFHGCTFYSSTYYGYNSTPGVLLANNVGYDPARNGTGSSMWSIGNTYVGGKLEAYNSPYFYSYYDTFTNSNIQVFSSDYAYVTNATIDNSGLAAVSGREYIGGVYFNLSNHLRVYNSSVAGYPAAQGAGGSVDDGVTFVCDGGPSTAPTVTCGDAIVDGLTAVDMFDAGVEFVGRWSGVNVLNGTYTRPRRAGIACFGYWACQMDQGWFDSNTVTSYNSVTRLVEFTAHGSYAGFFTGNYITNNSIDNTSSASYIGDSSVPWSSVSGNYIGGNVFGTSSNVSVQGAYGFTDGGGNYCASASAAITCH
jgi:hypothetical protein